MMQSLPYLVLVLAICIGAIILLTRYLSMHAFFSLLLASLTFGLLMGKPVLETVSTMQSGFGSLLQQIGFLVALGSCLGIILEKTGAMMVIGQRIIRLFGTQRSVFAMTMIGVLVGIPVFCDSGFIILSRMIPAMATQAGVNPAQLSLALSAGLYTTHTLVPPTPGPLAAAANLGLSENLSQVILIGLIASVPVAFASYFFARKLGLSVIVKQPTANFEKDQPPINAWKAFTPLVLPIVLISISNFPKIIPALAALEGVFSVVGHPVVALSIGLLLSFTLIQKTQRAEWPEWLAAALKDAGVILLITGAGGAFGSVIKSCGIDKTLNELISDTQTRGALFLVIGFVLAAVLKTAQGSTTSALIITSSLLAPLAMQAGFESAARLSVLVIAIGGGAMTVSHANDSYFWVVSQFGGIAPRDAFRSFTLLTFIQGVTALLTSLLLFFIL